MVAFSDRLASSAVVISVKSEVGEIKEAVKEIWAFLKTHPFKKTARNIFKRKYWGWWITAIVSIACGILLSQYHNEIITGIRPYKKIMAHAPGGWLIPLIILIIVSFPPLFGHEIIILVLGVVYTLPVAFAIACAGTFLGELACFYTAKHFLTRRAATVERKAISYACLAKLMREGGLSVSIIVRFSAIPGHIVTAIQSTIGISVWVYAIAATVSLPKQFALVYLGNVFGQLPQVPIDEWIRTHPLEKLSVYYSGADSAARRHHISLIVFAATTLSTVFAAIYVYLKARKVRPIVLAEFEAARIQQEKALEAGDEAIEDESIQLEEMEIVSPRVRPSFPLGSLSGLRVGVLQGGYGRGRSDSLNSPSASAPHLPLYSEAGTPGENFDGKDAKEGAALFTVNSTNSNCSSRRGSF